MSNPIVGRWICDLYGPEIIFIGNCSYDDIQGVLHLKCDLDISMPPEESDEIPAGGYTIGVKVQPSGELLHIVWIGDCRDIGAICHECVHLAIDVLKSHGVDFVSGDNEALTYYVQFWFNKFMMKIVHSKKRGVKKHAIDRDRETVKKKVHKRVRKEKGN